MKKRTRLVLLLAGSAFIGAIVVSISMSSAPNNLSFDLIYGDRRTHLTIPAAYVERGSIEDEHSSRFVALEMTFPDFRPLPLRARRNTLLGSRSAHQALLNSGVYFEITLNQGTKNGMPDLIREHIEHDWTPEPNDPAFPDFTIYSTNNKHLKEVEAASGVPTTYYLVPRDNKWRELVYFACPHSEQSPRLPLYCTATAHFMHDMYGSYTFHSANLIKWQDISDKVAKFVASLISS